MNIYAKEETISGLPPSIVGINNSTVAAFERQWGIASVQIREYNWSWQCDNNWLVKRSWVELVTSLFFDTRDFTKEETAKYNAFLKSKATFKRKLYHV